MDDEVVALCNKLQRMAETSTSEQFQNRLETIQVMYAYLEKAFNDRFPRDFVQWIDDQEIKAAEADEAERQALSKLELAPGGYDDSKEVK